MSFKNQSLDYYGFFFVVFIIIIIILFYCVILNPLYCVSCFYFCMDLESEIKLIYLSIYLSISCWEKTGLAAGWIRKTETEEEWTMSA